MPGSLFEILMSFFTYVYILFIGFVQRKSSENKNIREESVDCTIRIGFQRIFEYFCCQIGENFLSNLFWGIFVKLTSKNLNKPRVFKQRKKNYIPTSSSWVIVPILDRKKHAWHHSTTILTL